MVKFQVAMFSVTNSVPLVHVTALFYKMAFQVKESKGVCSGFTNRSLMLQYTGDLLQSLLGKDKVRVQTT
jgi:hypothetical protein